MALTKCTECGKEISSTALSCPHCGAPNKAEQAKEDTKKHNRVMSTFSCILMVCLFLFGERFGISLSYSFLIAIALAIGAIVRAVLETKMTKGNSLTTNLKATENNSTPETPLYVCPKCNSPVAYGESTCKACGQSFDWSIS